jgi:mono/diheme cytochrome c family protein
MRAPPFAVLVLFLACTAPAPEPAPPAPTPAAASAAPAAPQPAPVSARAEVADATRALFVAHCAQCHGVLGDGEGVTQLDRRARSFLEGGFSYGNTEEAILRSITHGIPGTPMPPFEKALSPEQCAALAQYVIALGPERIVVDPSESEMVVRDRPLVVYGKLPALVEGGPEIARGIVIGTPDGLTFEYRADDVQLVRVRAGRFVNRTDWDGRGGTGLDMLGTSVWSHASPPGLTALRIGTTHADGWCEFGRSAQAALIATSVEGDIAHIEYELTLPDEPAARLRVREECSSFRCSLGSGFVIRSSITTSGSKRCVATAKLSDDEWFLGISQGVIARLPAPDPVLVILRSRDAGMRSTGGQIDVHIDPSRATILERVVLLDLLLPATFPPDEAFVQRLSEELRPW